ncbi:hypothetical protein CXB51_025910 [Gossypium anomalum]|uniref:Uncharacterized protein n=1 Tax=Gossypium anomalum TaxID=47600 RepID=A0A8J5YEN4_9ROSI|nr:hypothetical protein CXB51_025910 [Gossypium anomalum]
MRIIGSSHFQNDVQEFIRKSLSSPPYVVVRFFFMSYSFGHHCVETITKQFLNPNQPFNETTHASVEAYHKVSINLLVQDFNDVYQEISLCFFYAFY